MSLSITTEQKQTLLWLATGCALLILFSMLGPVLMPFIVSATIAYVLNPWLDRLCALRIGRLRLPRSVAATLLIVLFIALVLGLIFVIVPILRREIPQLQDEIPLFLDRLDQFLGPKLAEYGYNIKLDSTGIKALLSEQFAGSSDVIGKAILSSIRVGGTAVIGMVANLLLIPIVLFYLLLDWHALIERSAQFIPRRWTHRATTALLEVDDILAQYLRGQLLVMLVLAIYYSAALSIARFDLALPVGIITGFLVFIPYLGFGLGLVLALIGAVLQFDGAHGLIAVAIIYGIGQTLESFFLTPRLVGERIGLHPLTVIFALMAFGQLFGFIGILVALPASAVVSVAVKHLRASYFNSPFYRQS
ncbi:AI-2E family transporter [Undibacterium sp. Ji67W]|uniref:AI-2E family transporter n=1 Tax=Undibacterium sp. Ji67W TaxID=3413042 RepID=UPI003BF29F3E